MGMLLHTVFQLMLQVSWAQGSQLMLPDSSCDQFSEHRYYSMCYSDEHRQAKWTTHLLERKSIRGKQKRTNNFREDPNLHDPVRSFDFSKSGYDRGHLVPAGDMKGSYQSMSETFFMSNMSPQRPMFNRRLWASLEAKLRSWVLNFGDAYVVTAPVLEDGIDRIPSGVSIPNHYYKIAYFPELEVMVAFLIEHKYYKHRDFRRFAVTVDEVEQLTGIDFFPELPDRLEDRLESTLTQL